MEMSSSASSASCCCILVIVIVLFMFPNIIPAGATRDGILSLKSKFSSHPPGTAVGGWSSEFTLSDLSE